MYVYLGSVKDQNEVVSQRFLEFLGLEGRPEYGQPGGWCLYRWAEDLLHVPIELAEEQLPLTAYGRTEHVHFEDQLQDSD